MTLLLKRKIAVAGSLLCLSLAAGAVYYFDVVEMMPKRIVSLPEITLDTIQTPNQRLPILLGNLFGLSPDSAITLTETNLNLTLKGTVPVFDKKNGMAIIMVEGKAEQVIRVGDEVLRGVTLDAVYGKYVVLSRSNAKEILRFPNSDEESKLLQLGGTIDADKLPVIDEVEGEENGSIGVTVSDSFG